MATANLYVGWIAILVGLVAVSSFSAQIQEAYELRAGFHRLAVELYSDEITKWRRENFNRKYLRASKHSSEKAT
ncbi:MAG: hypothetical protein ABIK89_21970 [Planctomycetota bacterium]